MAYKSLSEWVFVFLRLEKRFLGHSAGCMLSFIGLPGFRSDVDLGACVYKCVWGGLLYARIHCVTEIEP